MAIVRTVRGDLPADALGVCYAHEHVLGSPPAHLAEPDLLFDDFDAAARELQWFAEAGGRALVEMSTPDYHRDAAGLRRLSEKTGIHLLCATGYNKDAFSAPFVDGRSVDALAAHYVREITRGIDETGVRAGVVKAATTLNQISPNGEKMLRAAARAHRLTGAPVATHTEAGTMGLEQVAILLDEGMDPRKVVIGHVDRKMDWEYHLALARQGVYLSFDQIGKEKHAPDSERIAFILRLTAGGHGSQILLSGDMARRSYWPSYGTGGGPGLTYILWRFVPWLRASGLPEAAVTDLLVNNPARAFSFG